MTMRADILYPGNRVAITGDVGDYGHELPKGTKGVLLMVDEWDSLIVVEEPQTDGEPALTLWVDNKDLALLKPRGSKP